MSEKDLMGDLSELSKSWEEAEDTGGGFFELPEGEYEVIISDIEIGYSKNDRLQIVYSLTIIEGEYKNKIVKKFAGLDDPDRLGFVKGDLKRLGIECDNLEDLPEVLDNQAKGLTVLIACKKTTKGEITYTNIYFNKVLDEVPEEAEVEAAKKKPVSKKKTVKKKEAADEITIGKKAIYIEDNVEYEGLVSDISDKGLADFEDDASGEVWEIPISDLKAKVEKAEEEAPARRRGRRNK